MTQPTPPGDYLLEEIRERNIHTDVIIMELRWSSGKLAAVLVGDHPIGEAEAEDLNRVFGTSKEFWLNLQKAYDKGESPVPRQRPSQGDDAFPWVGAVMVSALVGMIAGNMVGWWMGPPTTVVLALILRTVWQRME